MCEPAPDNSEAIMDKITTHANPWPLLSLLVSGAAGLGVAIYFQVSGVQESLTAATWGLFAVITLWGGSIYLWGTTRSADNSDINGLIRGAAGIVITGALTLAFTSLGSAKGPAPLVLKVGIMALVIGVILAINMYALLLGKEAPGASGLAIALLFSYMCWAIAYGLLCIAFSVVLPS